MTRLHLGLGNTAKTMTEQIDWAVDQLRSNHKGLLCIIDDLRDSLDDISPQVQNQMMLAW